MTLEMDLHDRRVVPFAFLSSTPSAVKMWAVVLAPGKVSPGERIKSRRDHEHRSGDDCSYQNYRDGNVGRGANLECDESEESAKDDADRNQVNEEFDPSRVEVGVAEVEGTHVGCDGIRFVVGFGQHGIARRRFVATRLFGLESQAERGFADAELGALAEHGGADALLFEKCAVGGIEVAEVDVVFADFDDTVVARDFGVLQGDVGAVAADDNARLFEDVRGACAGAGDDGEDYVFRLRENGGGVLHDQRGLRAGGVAASERWEW
jgi:hypothetical protein